MDKSWRCCPPVVMRFAGGGPQTRLNVRLYAHLTPLLKDFPGSLLPRQQFIQSGFSIRRTYADVCPTGEENSEAISRGAVGHHTRMDGRTVSSLKG